MPYHIQGGPETNHDALSGIQAQIITDPYKISTKNCISIENTGMTFHMKNLFVFIL